MRASGPRPEIATLMGSLGPLEASSWENRVPSHRLRIPRSLSTALISSTVEINFLLHFCRFTKI